MKGLDELRPQYRRIVDESGLPDAPMTMPEQSLARARMRIFVFPFMSWFAWR